MRIEVVTNSENETFNLAKKLAKGIIKGNIVTLTGDLGAGKTAFVKGICDYNSMLDLVHSPTYTLVNEYIKDENKIYHFDLYRLNNESELYDIGFSEYLNEDAIVLIEWPEKAKEFLKGYDVIAIDINKDLESFSDKRTINIRGVKY